jgi:hypothetical protein
MGACSSKEEEAGQPVDMRPPKHVASGSGQAAQQHGDAGGVQPDASSKSVLGRWQVRQGGLAVEFDRCICL